MLPDPWPTPYPGAVTCQVGDGRRARVAPTVIAGLSAVGATMALLGRPAVAIVLVVVLVVVVLAIGAQIVLVDPSAVRARRARCRSTSLPTSPSHVASADPLQCGSDLAPDAPWQGVTPERPTRGTAWYFLGVTALTAVVFERPMRTPFWFDDFGYLGATLTPGWWHSGWIWDLGGAVFRPIPIILVGIQREVFGFQPVPFHLVAFGFVVAQGWLVYLIARRLGTGEIAARAAAAVSASGATSPIWRSRSTSWRAFRTKSPPDRSSSSRSL